MAVTDKDGPVPMKISQRDLLSSANDVIFNEEQYFAKYSQDSVCYVEEVTLDTFVLSVKNSRFLLRLMLKVLKAD